MRGDYLDDLQVDPETLSGSALLAHLTNRIDDTLAEVHSSEPWRAVIDPASPP